MRIILLIGMVFNVLAIALVLIINDADWLSYINLIGCIMFGYMCKSQQHNEVR